MNKVKKTKSRRSRRSRRSCKKRKSCYSRKIRKIDGGDDLKLYKCEMYDGKYLEIKFVFTKKSEEEVHEWFKNLYDYDEEKEYYITLMKHSGEDFDIIYEDDNT